MKNSRKKKHNQTPSYKLFINEFDMLCMPLLRRQVKTLGYAIGSYGFELFDQSFEQNILMAIKQATTKLSSNMNRTQKKHGFFCFLLSKCFNVLKKRGHGIKILIKNVMQNHEIHRSDTCNQSPRFHLSI